MATPEGDHEFSPGKALTPPSSNTPRTENQQLAPAGSNEKPARKRIDRTELAMRLGRAEMLVDAIARAHPDDARAVMSAALLDLCAGMPDFSLSGSLREDAAWWARGATEDEVLALTIECLRELPRRALHLNHRKRLLVGIWRGLPANAREGFLRWARSPDAEDAGGGA